MNKEVTCCEVIVNNEITPAHDIGFLYQKDPFPGNARYLIKLQWEKALTLKQWPTLSDLGYGVHTGLTQEIARRCLYEIERLVASTIDESINRVVLYRYFINTIERISLGEYELLAEGTCSTVIH